MGSRKQSRKEITQRQKFIAWYSALNINDKIAFKAFYWHYGRCRVSLMEMLQFPRFWHMTPLFMADAIDAGYQWMHLGYGTKKINY